MLTSIFWNRLSNKWKLKPIRNIIIKNSNNDNHWYFNKLKKTTYNFLSKEINKNSFVNVSNYNNNDYFKRKSNETINDFVLEKKIIDFNSFKLLVSLVKKTCVVVVLLLTIPFLLFKNFLFFYAMLSYQRTLCCFSIYRFFFMYQKPSPKNFKETKAGFIADASVTLNRKNCLYRILRRFWNFELIVSKNLVFYYSKSLFSFNFQQNCGLRFMVVRKCNLGSIKNTYSNTLYYYSYSVLTFLYPARFLFISNFWKFTRVNWLYFISYPSVLPLALRSSSPYLFTYAAYKSISTPIRADD